MLSFLSGGFPSNTAETVDNVMLYIVSISVVMLVGVTTVMIYFVFKYHRKKGHKPVDIHGNIWLEILWIGIPTILVLSMFYYGYMGFGVIRAIPKDAFTVHVTARMWVWQFDYPNGMKTDTLYVPVDKPIKLDLESQDVTHSLYIPAFRVKEDVVPGRKNYLSFHPTEVGRYHIACAEYCGLKHSMMYTEVVVMEKDDFEKWYGGSIDSTADNSAVDSVKTPDDIIAVAEQSHSLLAQKGCLTCHTIDGSEKIAPSFKGLAGTKRIVITDGDEREVVVDEDYLRRSILDPNADIVKGFAVGMMPSQKYNLNDKELAEVIKQIKSLN